MHDAYRKAVEVIERYYFTIHTDATRGEAQELFDCWLYGHFCSDADLHRQNEYEMWRHFAKYDKMKRLCDVALRLITVGTSDADDERLISAHKFLGHDRMTKIGADTLLA